MDYGGLIRTGTAAGDGWMGGFSRGGGFLFFPKRESEQFLDFLLCVLFNNMFCSLFWVCEIGKEIKMCEIWRVDSLMIMKDWKKKQGDGE